MAASLWKAWPTSLSFVVHGFIKCPVRTARSDVFRRSVRIITPEKQEKLLLKKQGYIVDDETNTESHIDVVIADNGASQKKTKIKNDKNTNFSKQTKAKTQLLKYEKLQEGDKRFGYVPTDICGFIYLFFAQVKNLNKSFNFLTWAKS